jgi:hypothetical protein
MRPITGKELCRRLEQAGWVLKQIVTKGCWSATCADVQENPKSRFLACKVSPDTVFPKKKGPIAAFGSSRGKKMRLLQAAFLEIRVTP